jgi:antitoxin component YwqK of YwqJK toxin-antitoxin module
LETYNDQGWLDGKFLEYNEQGKLVSAGSYKMGKPHGDWEYRYPFGGLLRTCRYSEGQLDGDSLQYAEKGQLIHETHYKKGKKDGWEIVFDDKSGKEILRKKYENGELVR